MKRFIVTACLVLSIAACAAKRPRTEKLPTGVISFSEELNAIKPLAEADYSGWAEKDGILVGAVDQKWVAAVSMKSRKVLWWTEGEEDLISPVTIIDDAVFLGFRDGKIRRVGLKTGKTIWQASLATFAQRPFVRHGDLVFAQTAGQQLYALDYNTGSIQWLYEAGFPDGVTVQGGVAPIVAEGNVVMGLASGELHAVSLENGRPVWRFDSDIQEGRFHDVVGKMFLVDNILVFARYDGSIFGLEISPSRALKVWEDKLASITTTAFTDNVFYVGTHVGDLIAFEPKSGRKLWTARTGESITSVSPMKKTIFVSGSNGRVNAIDLRKGEILWYDDVGGAIVSNPITYRNKIYFSTGYKNLYGYQIR